MKITKSFTPKNQSDWRKWLEKNHDREQEVWLVYFKPASGKSGVDYETSVEEALCFGWIDSIIQKIDEEKYARKFNPRRMDSKWSETNKRRVAKVIGEGRMTEAGMAKVTFDAKKVDISRSKLKKSKPPLEIPEKIQQALKSYPKVWDVFQKLAPSHKRNYILWLMDAKKTETFEKRLNMTIEELKVGKPTSMH
jgi:uncharacterized protein YdeI (YjbR/CyaY-like superfamily)